MSLHNKLTLNLNPEVGHIRAYFRGLQPSLRLRPLPRFLSPSCIQEIFKVLAGNLGVGMVCAKDIFEAGQHDAHKHLRFVELVQVTQQIRQIIRQLIHKTTATRQKSTRRQGVS